MIIKYINPILEFPYISEFSDAYITHNFDDDGQELPDYVIMLNCKDEYEHSICIRGASFTKLNEILNELYENGKIDISADPDVEVIAVPKAIMPSILTDTIDPEHISSILGAYFDFDDDDDDDEEDQCYDDLD